MHPVPDWISNASTAMQVPEALVVRRDVDEIARGIWPLPRIKQTEIGSANKIYMSPGNSSNRIRFLRQRSNPTLEQTNKQDIEVTIPGALLCGLKSKPEYPDRGNTFEMETIRKKAKLFVQPKIHINNSHLA